VAVARKGANLASYGKVAELIPTPSVLALGARGGYAGAPFFELIGRLQLDYGAGTWDEWLMSFGGGQWAWLAEAQGRFYFTAQAALPPVPEFPDLRVGQTIDLGPSGTFVVAEVRSARFVTARGELPFDVAPGTPLHYADLSGSGAQLATLDYGSGEAAEALYVGREVTLDEMGLRDLPSEDARNKAAAAQSLSCPHCGGSLQLRAPDKTQRVACPYCGSLLDATRDLAVLQALAAVPVQPLLPLGSKGTLDGVEWSLIGFMERSVTVEDVRYPWHEYLLYQPRHGFRWLVESSGHWSLVEAANPADVTGTGRSRRYQGRSYRHFQSARARVDAVVGEFYWAVAVGDEADTEDYVSPPHILSLEQTGEELNWSEGTYRTGREIWEAFRAPGAPPTPEGIAPNQPSPFTGRVKRTWSTALMGLALLWIFYIAFLILGGSEVHRQSVRLPVEAAPGAPEAVLFTEPFEIKRSGNVQIKVDAPVANSWLYLDGALINDETGGVDEFEIEVSYYNGTDSDGSWSEGGRSGLAYVGHVPPGRYVLRLAPQWENGKMPPGYEVAVRSRVPRFYQLLLAALALVLWPLALAWRAFRFEVRRWADSDHPMVTSG
jgi:DNA-directed RNA polymerase subunit RPC12/RpoP